MFFPDWTEATYMYVMLYLGSCDTKSRSQVIMVVDKVVVAP